MTDHRDGATGLLARMLTGVTMTGPGGLTDASGDPVPDLGGNITLHGDHGVEMTMMLPSGDRYRVIVEWLKEESP